MIFTPIHALSVGSDKTNESSQRPDLALISGKKFPLVVDNESFEIYYGIILGTSSDQDYAGKIISMTIKPEKKSLLIDFDNVLQTDNVWIRFPNKVISADNEKFILFVDGIEKGYELSSHGNETRLGFVIKEGTKHVEIIGTNVIPEFPSSALSVFLLIFCPVFLFSRTIKKMKML